MARTARKAFDYVEPPRSSKRVFYYAKYLRKSTEEDDSRSIVNQDAVLDGLIERIIAADTKNTYVFVDTYKDENYTGTDSDRPAFKKLLRDIGSGKINMLLVTDLSRLSRNIAESINYVQGLFVALDVRFVSSQLPMMDSYLEPDRIYSLEIPMQSMMNENHCAETSFKVRRTFNRLREQGKYIGAFAAYGWKKDPTDKHRLLLDEEACEVMHQIKQWIFDGKSLGSIVRTLNEHGVLNPTGYKVSKGINYRTPHADPSFLWSATTLRRLMVRPENTGTLVQGRYRIKSYKIHTQIRVPEEEWFITENGLPAIFTKEEQEKLISCLKRDTRTSPNNKAKELYLFSGYLKCADCGRAVIRKPCRDYVYYVCSTFKRFGKIGGCTKHTIRHEKLEGAVLTAIQQQVNIAVNLQEMMETIDAAPAVANRAKKYEIAIQAKSKELQKIQKYKRSLYEDWKDGNLTQEEYLEMKFTYTEQEDTIHQILETLESEKKQIALAMDTQNPFFVHFVKYRNIGTLTRDILIELVDNILIHEGGGITIRFRFADEYQKIISYLENRKSLPA